MAIIKGIYYYHGTREYKYEVDRFDLINPDDKTVLLSVTNPKGITLRVRWDYKRKGIESTIKEFIEGTAKSLRGKIILK